MNYSELFIRRAALAAQDRRGAEDWMSLPLGERVTLIYREMQRLDVPGAEIAPLSAQMRASLNAARAERALAFRSRLGAPPERHRVAEAAAGGGSAR